MPEGKLQRKEERRKRREEKRNKGKPKATDPLERIKEVFATFFEATGGVSSWVSTFGWDGRALPWKYFGTEWLHGMGMLADSTDVKKAGASDFPDIVALNLQGNGLQGSSKDINTLVTQTNGISIRCLCDELRSLRLSSNNLPGKFPKSILFQCKKLLALHLSGVGLTGKIPYELKNLSQLQFLDLSFNQLEL